MNSSINEVPSKFSAWDILKSKVANALPEFQEASTTALDLINQAKIRTDASKRCTLRQVAIVDARAGSVGAVEQVIKAAQAGAEVIMLIGHHPNAEREANKAGCLVLPLPREVAPFLLSPSDRLVALKYTYSFRAECTHDIDRLSSALRELGVQFSIESSEIDPDFPDAKAEFKTDAALNLVQTVMRKLDDGHVMLQTLRPVPLEARDLHRDCASDWDFDPS